jgi:hypothetical protein
MPATSASLTVVEDSAASKGKGKAPVADHPTSDVRAKHRTGNVYVQVPSTPAIRNDPPRARPKPRPVGRKAVVLPDITMSLGESSAVEEIDTQQSVDDMMEDLDNNEDAPDSSGVETVVPTAITADGKLYDIMDISDDHIQQSLVLRPRWPRWHLRRVWMYLVCPLHTTITMHFIPHESIVSYRQLYA